MKHLEVIVSILVTGCVIFLLADVGQSLYLHGRSFNLNSRVKRWMGNSSDVEYIFETQEQYSSDQKRAVLRAFTDNNLEVYHDAKTKTTINHQGHETTCQSIHLSDVVKEIFGDLEAVFSLYEALDSMIPNIAHIIGPAKLLYLIEAHAKDMTRITMSTEHDAMQIVRYDANFITSKTQEQVFLTAYYIKVDDKTDYLKDRIPDTLVVSGKDGSNLVVIDFNSFELIDDRIHADLSYKSVYKVFDDFAFPTIPKCVELLSNDLKGELFEKYPANKIRLSFKASIESLTGQRKKAFVAIDGTASMMRIDLDENESDPHFYIFDYRKNRRYLIYFNPDKSYRTIGDVYSIEIPEVHRQKLGHCAMTNIYAMENKESGEFSKDFKHFDLGSFLIGSSKFYYLGRAVVRGIDARIYYTSTKGMVEWMQPHLPKLFESKDDEYNALVYVADRDVSLENVSPLRLLLLELYQDDVEKFSIEFHDFIWDLTDAPGGDRADNLFSLYEQCSESVNSYVEIDMLIEASKQSYKNRWIEKWLKRNLALAASLPTMFKFSSTMMYDIESKLIGDSTTKNKIAASFKLAEHPQLLTRLIYIGMGDLTTFGLEQRSKIISSVDMNYCFYLAASARDSKVKSMFYDSVNSECLIDVEGPADSRLVKLDAKGTFEIYRVEPTADTEINLVNSRLRDADFNQLVGQTLRLESAEVDKLFNPNEETEFSGVITKLKIKNNNFISDPSIDKDDGKPMKFVFGVTIDRTGDGIRKVDATGSAKSESANMNFMPNLEQCEARCLEDLECKAFSFCDRYPDFECKLVDFPLLTPEVLKELKEKNFLSSRLGTKITVKANEGNEITLRRESTCEIYSKRFLNMFYWEGYVEFTLTKREVIAVDNEEQCAEFCFDRTLEALKLSAELGSKVSQLIESSKSGKNSGEQQTMIDEASKEHELIQSKICNHISYIDESLSDAQMKYLKKRGLVNDKRSNSYCVLSGIIPDVSQDASPVFRAERSYFDFTKLYEKRSNIGLRPSPLEASEVEAAYAAVKMTPLNSAEKNAVKRVLGRGKNLINRYFKQTADGCAEMCFKHSGNLWPTCRSFDFESDLPGSTSGSCILNTQTLETVSDQDKRYESSSPSWAHYEPRFGLINKESHLSYDLEISRDDEDDNSDSRSSFSFGAFGVFLLIVLGIVAGIYAGIYMTRRFSFLAEKQEIDTNVVMPTQLEPEL